MLELHNHKHTRGLTSNNANVQLAKFIPLQIWQGLFIEREHYNAQWFRDCQKLQPFCIFWSTKYKNFCNFGKSLKIQNVARIQHFRIKVFSIRLQISENLIYLESFLSKKVQSFIFSLYNVVLIYQYDNVKIKPQDKLSFLQHKDLMVGPWTITTIKMHLVLGEGQRSIFPVYI